MADTDTYSGDELLPIGDVARMMNASVATIRRWESAGKLSAIRTPGGQRRFRREDVDALKAGAA